jgi:putative molybdopterin biosynthesis protein
MTDQEQFLHVLDRDEARRRFEAALDLSPRPPEQVPLSEALGRVLAEAIHAPVDVPAFDRANVDGYAVQAADTFGATELAPRIFSLTHTPIKCGELPRHVLQPGQAIPIATGGMLPRGADAVVMIEHTDVEESRVLVRRPVTPGANVTFAGTDITAGELLLFPGQVLTSRETALLAAVGIAHVPVTPCPRVAVISTGDELIPPGAPLRPGGIYDSNGRMLADAVREAGGLPVEKGIVPDDPQALRQALDEALKESDVVLLSGGTSKGEGDLCYRIVGELGGPGIVAHGVALKPGKPLCLAVTRGKGVVVLPGFPTSAIFTFHEFVAPVIRVLAGRSRLPRKTVEARLAVRVQSEIGRTEYLLVSLAPAEPIPTTQHPSGIVHRRNGNSPRPAEEAALAEEPLGAGEPLGEKAAVGANDSSTEMPSGFSSALVAWPMGKGSGSVTAFSKADGFIVLDQHQEQVEAGTPVTVTLLSADKPAADLVIMGSHCIGLDLLLAQLHEEGWTAKLLVVGSMAGLEAVRRGQCDVAGVHLCDPATGEYNRPFATGELSWVRGWGRIQGLVFRPDDERFVGRTAQEALAAARSDPTCLMVNRNAGSGTRLLIDQLLAGARPAGYAVQPRSHHAVAAAVRQGRADWGVCIASVAAQAGLGFLPLVAERYDFLVLRPAVKALLALLQRSDIRRRLAALGLDA